LEQLGSGVIGAVIIETIEQQWRRVLEHQDLGAETGVSLTAGSFLFPADEALILLS
jgi:hypothetical protein